MLAVLKRIADALERIAQSLDSIDGAVVSTVYHGEYINIRTRE